MKLLIGLALLGAAIVYGILYERGRKRNPGRMPLKKENRYFGLCFLLGLLGLALTLSGLGVKSGGYTDENADYYRTRSGK